MSSHSFLQVFLAMLDSDKGKTETGRLQAIAIAKKEEKRMIDNKLALIKEINALRAESKSRLGRVVELMTENNDLAAKNTKLHNHVVAIDIDNMMLRQENERLLAELARLRAPN
jgi:hypothetical protein